MISNDVVYDLTSIPTHRLQFPGAHHVKLLEDLFNEGLEIDHTCIPFRSKFDFIGEHVRLGHLLSWSIAKVAPINFYVKHHVGLPRPEVRSV